MESRRPLHVFAWLAGGLLAAAAGGACSADERTDATAPTPAASNPSGPTGGPFDEAAPDQQPDQPPDQSTTPSDPGSGPGPSAGPDPADREVTVTVVGDIMLGRGVGAVASAAGDPSAPLRPMADRLARAEITVGNLESTLSTDGQPRQGDDSFAAPPAVLGGLRAAGFDVLDLANNHTGDFGRPALVETVRRVRSSGIAPLGAGGTRALAWRPVVIERHGVRVGFLAFNAIGETYRAGQRSPGAASLHMGPRTGPLDTAELARVRDRVRQLAGRTDVVIVLPHWGDQYTHRPVADQIRVGRALLDAGATLVVGGHPHWVQDVQRHEGRFVVHSLGNFVFDMDFMQQTQEGIVLDVTFRAGDLVRASVTPYVIGADYAPRPVRGAVASAILDDIRGLAWLPQVRRVSP